jgi:hypothetical protein
MQKQPNIDLKNTQPILGFEGGNIFNQGFIIRKVSKFIAGTEEDSFIPIPVFYDVETKRILLDTLPPELRDEYKNISI